MKKANENETVTATEDLDVLLQGIMIGLRSPSGGGMASLKRTKEGEQPKPKRAKPTPWELIKKEELMELEKQFSNLPYKEKWEYIQCRLFPDNSRTPAACNAMWSILRSTQEDRVESNREERAKLSAAAGGRSRKSPHRFEQQTFPGSYDTASTASISSASDDEFKECPDCIPGSGKEVRHTGRHVTVVKGAGAGAGSRSRSREQEEVQDLHRQAGQEAIQSSGWKVVQVSGL